MPDALSIADVVMILIPTSIGAAIGLLGPIWYARRARRRKDAQTQGPSAPRIPNR